MADLYSASASDKETGAWAKAVNERKKMTISKYLIKKPKALVLKLKQENNIVGYEILVFKI